MKKRIVCVLLTLIMLMSLVPMSASAAGMKISESAITILKQLEGYTANCSGKGTYFGYGTVCDNKKHSGKTYHGEKDADEALRAHLAELDEAVNSFASKKGLSLSQSKHDALVLFSFENGTAWTTGTGDFQAAVASGKTGNDFLNAICWWDNSENDDARRMIEANMYLNGVYSSTKPSRYIRVEFNANGGTMTEAKYQYFDVAKAQNITIAPTKSYHTFMGWYTHETQGEQVTSLNTTHSGDVLYAHWQSFAEEAGENSNAYYTIEAKNLASTIIYSAPNGVETKLPKASGLVTIDSEFIDDNGNRWGHVVEVREVYDFESDSSTVYKDPIGWVKLKVVKGSAASDGVFIDVTVTVTNTYVRSRKNATIHSAQNGTYHKGDQLRIINTADADGFLWGQVAQSATDNTPIGWVALMYTNFDAVRNESNSTSTISIATATVTYNGYLNVRSDAGTDNQIVGALPSGAKVDLYETKYVNGIQWGRCKTGWICLAYTNVENLNEDVSKITDVGFTSYAFTGTLTDPNSNLIYEAPSMNAEVVRTMETLDPNVTITNLTFAEGYTWGKFSKGWIRVSDENGNPVDIELDTAKFMVSADSLTVRENPSTDAKRVDTLTKNVEFNVNETNQIVVVGDSIWGYATKVGEGNNSYKGWVNLANKYVTRNGAPTVESTTGTAPTGLMATVINTNALKVRITGASYGKQLGTLTMGTTAAVLEEKDGWYNLDIDVDGNPETGSWVSGAYLNVYEASASNNSTSGSTSTGTTTTVQTGMGVVANTYSGVNVRTGAGTGYGMNGKLLPGTAVEILEVVTKGASKWGRIAQGWVCMDYITMVSNYEIADYTSGSSNGSTTNGTTTATEIAIYTGTTRANVNVRKEPSLKADIVRELAAGAPVTMHEIVTVTEDTTSTTADSSTGSTTTTVKTTSYWARVNDGYIYNPADHLNLDTLDEHTYTMTESNTLNVRNNPGTEGTSVLFKLSKGDQVKITKLDIVNGSVWGFVECDEGTGWASLKYMTKGAITIQEEVEDTTTGTTGNNTTTTQPNLGVGSNVGGYVTNTSGYRYTGKVIRTNSLNVRATASETAAKTTTMSNGQAMVIYETSTVNGMAWGRCDAGWVYLYYVDLTPVTGAVDARVVANDNTVIYSDMNCSSTTGSTYAKQAVIDIYEIVGKMARTDMGWVNTDNLL